MKTYFKLGAVILFTALSMVACKEDPIPQSNGTLDIEFVLDFNETPYALQEEVTGDDGVRFKFETVKFYVSNPELHSENQVANWQPTLIDFENSEPQIWSVPAVAQTYSGISFGIGLDPTTNATDPSSVEVSNPLSSLQNMYWTWASKYIFWKVEGRADTGSGNYDMLFLFHIGMDSFYQRSDELMRSIQVPSGESATLRVHLDLHDVFYAEGNALDLRTENETQTMDNMILAQKVNQNFQKAFY